MKARIFVLGLICLFLISCKDSPQSPFSPEIPSNEPSTTVFSGLTYITDIRGPDDIPDVLTVKWTVVVTNMSLCEGKVVQVDRFIYHWDGDLYETEAEMPVIWTGTSYCNPPVALPLSYNLDSPSSIFWKHTDTDIPHPGYLPNRGKVVVRVEFEGQIYVLESKLAGINWQ